MPRDASDLLHGTLDVLILKTLSWDAMHGYAIAEWIEKRGGGELVIVDAALYKALHRLEDAGVDRVRVGRVRQQPPREVLLAHRARPRPAPRRGGDVEALRARPSASHSRNGAERAHPRRRASRVPAAELTASASPATSTTRCASTSTCESKRLRDAGLFGDGGPRRGAAPIRRRRGSAGLLRIDGGRAHAARCTFANGWNRWRRISASRCDSFASRRASRSSRR